MRRRLCAQAGQTAAEYMGALLIVSVIIAAVAMTGVGTQITGEMTRIVCEIAGGGDCGEPEVPEPSECVVSAATDKVTIKGAVDLKWFTVKLESGVEYTRQKRANGEVAMTFKIASNGGLAERLKKLIDVTVKGGPASSVTFLLPDDEAANRFGDQIEESAKALALAPVQRFGIGDEYDVEIDWPPIETVQFEYGGGVSGSAEVDSAGGYGEASFEGGQALGYKQNLTEGRESSGDRTVFYRVNAKGSGAAGVPMIGPGFTGNLAGDLTLSVTWGADGSAKKLSLLGTGSYDGGVQFRGAQQDLAAALKYIDALDLKGSERSGKKLEFQVDLALTDENEKALALAFLQGVNPAGGVVNQVAAGRQLWDLVQREGKIQMRTYDTDASSASIDLGLPLVRLANGGIAFDSSSAELTGASEYVPGQGFVPSETCVR